MQQLKLTTETSNKPVEIKQTENFQFDDKARKHLEEIFTRRQTFAKAIGFCRSSLVGIQEQIEKLQDKEREVETKLEELQEEQTKNLMELLQCVA